MDVWKAIAGALASVLATGLAAWFAFGSGNVSSVEMERYVDQRIDAEREITVRIEAALGRLSEGFNRLADQQSATNAKLEMVIRQSERSR